MKYLFIILGSLLVLSCGDQDEKKWPEETFNVFKPLIQPADCESGEIAKDLEGSWYALFNYEGQQDTFSLNFDGTNDVVTVGKVCRWQQLTLETSVTASFLSDTTSFEIISFATDKESLEVDQIERKCLTSVFPSIVSYKLEGSCLVVGNGDKAFYMKRPL